MHTLSKIGKGECQHALTHSQSTHITTVGMTFYIAHLMNPPEHTSSGDMLSERPGYVINLVRGTTPQIHSNCYEHKHKRTSFQQHSARADLEQGQPGWQQWRAAAHHPHWQRLQHLATAPSLLLGCRCCWAVLHPLWASGSPDCPSAAQNPILENSLTAFRQIEDRKRVILQGYAAAGLCRIPSGPELTRLPICSTNGSTREVTDCFQADRESQTGCPAGLPQGYRSCWAVPHPLWASGSPDCPSATYEVRSILEKSLTAFRQTESHRNTAAAAAGLCCRPSGPQDGPDGPSAKYYRSHWLPSGGRGLHILQACCCC